MYLSQFISVSVTPSPFPPAPPISSLPSASMLWSGNPPLTFLSDSKSSDHSYIVTKAPSARPPNPDTVGVGMTRLAFPSCGSQLTPWGAGWRRSACWGWGRMQTLSLQSGPNEGAETLHHWNKEHKSLHVRRESPRHPLAQKGHLNVWDFPAIGGSTVLCLRI